MEQIGTPPVRTAMYCRCAGPDTESIEEQIRVNHAWAAALGYELIDDHIYIDWALSGAPMDRPGWSQLMHTTVQPGCSPFAVLLMSDYSRIARDSRHIHDQVAALAQTGVRIECPGEAAPYAAQTGPMDELRQYVLHERRPGCSSGAHEAAPRRADGAGAVHETARYGLGLVSEDLSPHGWHAAAQSGDRRLAPARDSSEGLRVQVRNEAVVGPVRDTREPHPRDQERGALG